MPQTKTKPAALPKPKAEPKPTTSYTWKSKNLIERVKDGLKERLLYRLDEFLKEAYPEEARFLLEVLNERDSLGGYRKSRGQYEVPLFSALEEIITGCSESIVLLPDRNMAPQVEEFIQSLEKNAEAGTAVIGHPNRTPSEIRAMRETDLKSFAELFAQYATAEDLFFLDGVFERWDVYRDYADEDRPRSPIMAAFQYEIDGQSWLIRVAYDDGPHVSTLARMIEQKDWLSSLLNWIAEKGADNLSPCLVASKAAGMQEAWDKARDNAA